MNLIERVDADFRGTGLTLGRHPVAHHRDELNQRGVLRAADIPRTRHGSRVRVAGWVIVRQRPGTAKGFVFLSMEDETGITNVIINPDVYEKNRSVIIEHPFLLVEGRMQNQDGVFSVKAEQIEALYYSVRASASHDFH